jgi:uncharacterized membrane protein
MTLLIIGIVAFLGLHLLPTIPGVRDRLLSRFGENGYKAGFSLLSIVAFVLLVWGFARAPVIQVWSPPSWTRWVAIVLMLPAFIFLVAAYVPGQIKGKLKHPFLVAIKTWALAHLIANGDLASIILFASFLAYAAYDRITLEAARGDGAGHCSGDWTAAERHHRRGRRRRPLPRFLVLAASALDRHLAIAAMTQPQGLQGRSFALQNCLYFCHKTGRVFVSSGA